MYTIVFYFLFQNFSKTKNLFLNNFPKPFSQSLYFTKPGGNGKQNIISNEHYTDSLHFSMETAIK